MNVESITPRTGRGPDFLPKRSTGQFSNLHRWILPVFATILLVAAALKASALLSEPPGAGWVARHRLGLMVPALEVSLAVWLLAGAARVWATRATIVTLVVFIAVARWSLLTTGPCSLRKGDVCAGTCTAAPDVCTANLSGACVCS
jgi:hypothetical protein